MRYAYKLIIAYDGTPYKGWQVQKNQKSTIVNVMQQAFKGVFKHEVSISGASRTDAGVHALGQVAKVNIPFHIASDILKYAWNNALGGSIYIRSLTQIEESFHPRKQVQDKIYWYHFFTKQPLPFARNFVWQVPSFLDQEKLKEALSVFVGTHDFRSFCTGIQHNTICRIDAIEFEYVKKFDLFRIQMIGNRFGRHMVRRIVGACIYTACKPEESVKKLEKILEQKNPHTVLFTAPAHGLMLRKINYKRLSHEIAT